MKKEAKEVAKRLLVQLKQNFTSTGLKNLINDHAPLVKLAGLKWVHLINCNFIVAVIVELLILSRKKLGHDEIYFASTYEKKRTFFTGMLMTNLSMKYIIFFYSFQMPMFSWNVENRTTCPTYHFLAFKSQTPDGTSITNQILKKKIKKRSQQIVTYIVKVCTF